MSISSPKKQKKQIAMWILFIGLLGIFNFIIGCWVLFPPQEGSVVFFWPVQFYNIGFIPSLFFFPVSLICILVWVMSLIERGWMKAVISLAWATLTVLCFMNAFGIFAFVSTFHIYGKVKQNDHVYYLAGHLDDEAMFYDVCKADLFGFSGHCRNIGGSSGDPPKIYIDPVTNLVTVESKNPSFVWINSDPPRCINNLNENIDEVWGGCSP